MQYGTVKGNNKNRKGGHIADPTDENIIGGQHAALRHENRQQIRIRAGGWYEAERIRHRGLQRGVHINRADAFPGHARCR